MKAITTKFLGATNTKPARIVASDSDGNRAIITYPDLETSTAHRMAAIKLCDKMGWTGGDTLIEGGIAGGRVFVFSPSCDCGHHAGDDTGHEDWCQRGAQ